MRTLALFLTGLSAALIAHGASVPRPSPELTMQRGGPAPLLLSQFHGKIVALAFGHSTCDHCQVLTRTLSVIQKDYAARNVQVVECIFEDEARVNYPMFLKALEPNFPTGYTNEAAVKKYLMWNDKTDGILMIPYMIFIDAAGTIRGDFSGKDGFFSEADKRIRAELDKMTKKPAAKGATKKKDATK
jgi:hypothetical protein